MLVTSIFSFYHNVFKRLLFHGRKKLGLCGIQLTFIILVGGPQDKAIYITKMVAKSLLHVHVQLTRFLKFSSCKAMKNLNLKNSSLD